ncbi:mitochondrial enolase superfamily member 1-like [Liolophura sinensis]|uniref:mitochondrial enolase superfamily member 1-like n=1 Tax=Liolophura sinensis TaxID=3198878 RepID=UPI00315992C5
MAPTVITQLNVKDIRFPTSLDGSGSDASHRPDYSCAYVELKTDTELTGYGLTFTSGRGNEIVSYAAKVFRRFVVGQKLADIFGDFASFYRKCANDDQMRWIGPEKGVIHLALSAVFNALWDIKAKMAGKPLWKLLVDMTPEEIVSVVDFRYITDLLTKEEALEMLRKMQDGKKEREAEIVANGYPAYTMSCGWLGYDDDQLKKAFKSGLAQGFTRFKMKVGGNIEDDQRRCKIIRDIIGYDKLLMMDANQKWDVQDAVDWMKQLTSFKPFWIEEPTNPDDILGHKKIAKELNPLGINVATGEQCQNRIMFKQFLEFGALQICQIDCCRLGSINELIPVILMAAKMKVPVCPHGGGVGLSEYARHTCIFDYVCVSGDLENRIMEYADHLSPHFENPNVVRNGNCVAPVTPGYSPILTKTAVENFEYPEGKTWEKYFADGTFPPVTTERW